MLAVGQTIHARLNEETLTSIYPWEAATVPVKIIGVYPKFIVGTVLPHKNPKGFRKSGPYNVTISNYDLKTKRIVIEGRQRK